MNIRQANEKDIEIIEKITIVTIKEVYPHYYPKGAVDYFLLHHRQENIENDIKNNFVYLLEESRDTIATVTITGNEISRLFVLPKYQRMGYGTALLEYAESKIFLEYKEVQIDASLPAKEIYIKRGYQYQSSHTIITDGEDFLCYDVFIHCKPRVTLENA